jgi:hypothetical protein
MTLHVVYDHECEACGAIYVPYDDDVPCPKCGLVEEDRFDFIPEAVVSLRFNKFHGSYRPPAWWVGSLGDHILNLLFGLLDTYEEEKPDSFREFVASRLAKIDWGDQEYLQNHVLGIALRVHEELEKDDK